VHPGERDEFATSKRIQFVEERFFGRAPVARARPIIECVRQRGVSGSPQGLLHPRSGFAEVRCPVSLEACMPSSRRHPNPHQRDAWLEELVRDGVTHGPRGGVVLKFKFRPLNESHGPSFRIAPQGRDSRAVHAHDVKDIFGRFGLLVRDVAHEERATRSE
jgi:hypothetical protein